MSAEIKSIKVRVGETEEDLTLDQARALKRALDSIFPETKDRFVPIPAPYPVGPLRWPWDRPYYEVTWGSETVSSKLDGNTAVLSVGSTK